MKSKPKVLFYDVETTPNEGYSWGKYEQNIIKFTREWELLSVAWKWLGEPKIYCVTREGRKDDLNVAMRLHELFSEADLIIAHNGDQFDQKRAKARMIYHHMLPPKVLNSIDTKKVAKAYFAFNGNGLDELAQHLGIGRKFKHQGFDLWEGCMADDPKAWRVMERYNKKDVTLLEKVYKRFLPWIQNHPNIARLLRPYDKARGVCPNCGCTRTRKRGTRATMTQLKQEWSCYNCGARFLTALEKRAK